MLTFGFGVWLRLLIFGCCRDLNVFCQIEIELIQALGLRAKSCFVVARQLRLEALNLIGLRFDLSHQQLADRPKVFGFFGKGFEVLEHGIIFNPFGGKDESRLTHPVCNGRHVFCGMRQLMPSPARHEHLRCRGTFNGNRPKSVSRTRVR